MGALLRALAFCAMTAAGGGASAQVLEFDSLDGWAADDHRAALSVFRATCPQLTGPEWQPLCRLADDAMHSGASARSFFELFFKPVQVGAAPALFTGYYEPELPGSPHPTPRFAFPIYAKPPELAPGAVWRSRAEIESGALRGRGLEIAWLDDPVEAFFLQVQGSGRIRMPDGRVMRVGYAAKNGHPYRSIGQELVRRGTHRIEDVSAQSIRDWVRRNPAEGAALLLHNPSYVFFRKLTDLPADQGPIGAMGRPVTPMRTLAVDPAFTPLGAPVWVEKDGAEPLRRLFVAQDTGGAIKGALRADIFYGTGAAAGDRAGTVKDGGRMLVLLPIDRAFAMLPEN
ncbi:murein transglycosylase [Cereibacter changlensis JA139]|uniref:peptidoglycan lytic exotransglycosylase n=2 Tax=Cereibacter changlensis TaxID=402884 RepID=A0A2T4K0Z3_9RHOB|nr:MltA domain-containing protein [Cereibacter changlensis]PTE23808.1 murein transglycosylase [Cereibacter changlensis JA139]PZX58979.1 membrane-bound lytic murein transglycosylase A [Cereibacter changlensis]